MPAIIEISELTKKFGNNFALDNINLRLDEPEMIGLVGKNGAGKTTLMSIISGAMKQTSGKVNVFEHPPGHNAIINRITILLQEANFKKGIPVYKQLIHFARLQDMSTAVAKKQVNELLEKLNNVDTAKKKPETLSFGQRKRLGIVQTLIGHPDLVMLDEPTAGLDPVAASEIRKFIQSMSRNVSFIISSHNLNEIEDICSRIVILDKGKLVTSAPIAEFAHQNTTLNLVLNRPLELTLKDRLQQLPEIIEIISNEAQLEKLAIHFNSNQTDQLQLKIQSLIIEEGYSIVQMHRGKDLAEGIMEIVE
jgi:ABC-2 type transport system ATP-binding protein